MAKDTNRLVENKGRTCFDGAVAVQAADWLHAGDVEGQAAAAVPPAGNGDAKGMTRLLLQAHRLLLTREPTGWILHNIQCHNRNHST